MTKLNIFLCALVFALGACGQKGPLYLESDLAAESSQESAEEVVEEAVDENSDASSEEESSTE